MLITCHPNDNIEYDAEHFTTYRIFTNFERKSRRTAIPAMGNGREGEVQEGDIRPPW